MVANSKTRRRNDECRRRYRPQKRRRESTLRLLIRSLSFDAAKLLIQAFISTGLDYCNTLGYCAGSARTCTDAYKSFKTPHTPLITNTYAIEHMTSVLQQLHWIPVRQCVQFKITVLVYKALHGGRLSTYVCHWTPTIAFVAYSAANQHTSWRSLIHCCWTSSLEQSANPAA